MSGLSLGFIGLGLIGGSIAKAIKEAHPDYTLIAYDHLSQNDFSSKTDTDISHTSKGDCNKSESNLEKTNINFHNKDISMAIESKVIDYVVNDLTFLSHCKVIFLCAPVLNNIEYLSKLKDIITPNTILTDVGSVKGHIHQKVEELNLDKLFIGGHPMTGSEKTGYAHSSSTLLENAYYILTPTKASKEEDLSFLSTLIKEIKALPVLLNYSEHDKITAAISHLPHIIASSLVNLVESSDDNSEHMRHLAAGGFKDITRIASSSPTIWQNICLTNRDSIIYYLEQYINSLNRIKLELEDDNGEYLYNFFDNAKEYRDALPKEVKGLGISIYEIFVDLQDVTGAIANVASLLANNSISIKNIGIIHNREFEEGVLRIEFYNNMERKKAAYLLEEHNYKIYKR